MTIHTILELWCESGAVVGWHCSCSRQGCSTSGNVYVADTGNHCVRMITPAGMVSTIARDGTEGFADGPLGFCS